VTIVLVVAVLAAMTFTFAYAPIVTYVSRGLISPYTKADVRKRLIAASIDGLLVATLCLFAWIGAAPLYVALGAGYLLLRDAIGGQSIGKILLGLVVIDLETGRVASLQSSVKRNFLLLLPGANVVAIVLEARTILSDPQGQRLGDRLAQTQVVEGAGARDLAKSVQDWLLSLTSGLVEASGRRRRRRAPGGIDRAA
jgi:uncharacterized RDD family membrane protein YckC